MTNNDPIIQVRDLSFSYNGEPALSNISFDIAEKEFLAIIGPNGGGKSTLVKLMLGLLEPDSGYISIHGRSPKKMAHRFGYVPQDVSINIHFPVSVMDVVLMGRLRHRGRRGIHREDRQKAMESMQMMGVAGYENRTIKELSAGQRERVFIARALTADPEILILDEPTASVDTGGKTELYHLLGKLNDTKTVIVVSHDLMIISSYVKSVACVNRSLHYHHSNEITETMLEMGYQCPVELIAHGQPHRILKTHGDL
ncbi:MAG: ABC transporter ATP-binding protein [Desulfosalsimonadaceae bacterium]